MACCVFLVPILRKFFACSMVTIDLEIGGNLCERTGYSQFFLFRFWLSDTPGQTLLACTWDTLPCSSPKGVAFFEELSRWVVDNWKTLIESSNSCSLFFKKSLELWILIEFRDSPDCINDHFSLSRIDSCFSCSGLRSDFTNVGFLSSPLLYWKHGKHHLST